MRTAIVLLLLAAHGSAAPKKKAAKAEALDAVAACVAAAPAVDASTAAARDPRGGGPCATARRALMSALQKSPHDKELAGAALDLNGAGWFELSEKAKSRLRVTAGRKP